MNEHRHDLRLRDAPAPRVAPDRVMDEGHARGPAAKLTRVCDVALILVLVASIAWLVTHPSGFPEADLMDVASEGLMVLGALVGYWFVRRLRVPTMTLGWGLIGLGLLADLMDEFAVDSVVAATTQPVALVSGYLLAALGLFASQSKLRREIRRARDAEVEAAASRQEFEELFHAAPVGYLEMEADEVVVRANLAAHELLGVEPGQLDGAPLGKFRASDPADGVEVVGEAVLAPGVSEEHLRRTDGEVRSVLVHRGRGSDGADGRQRVALVDVTEERRARRERDQLERQLAQNHRLETIGTLAGGVAHDFNNLLVPILGNVELVLQDLEADSGVREDLLEILTAAQRAQGLVKQILTFARQGDRTVLPVKLDDLVDEVTRLLRHTLPANIRVQVDSDVTSSVVQGDPGQFHQVLMNLCTNAAHAMRGGGGTLTLRLTSTEWPAPSVGPEGLEPGAYLVLEVRDTGTGMDSDTVSQVFDPFFTTKGPNEGTGMGLSVAHGIITEAGGTIEVESALGVGTTFRIYLPASSDQMPAHPGTTPSLDTLDDGAPRILLVDDEPTVLRLTKRILDREGFQVVAHADPQAALRDYYANPGRVDLVLTDQTLPGLTGMALARAIREGSPRVPIILMTGNSTHITPEAREEIRLSTVLDKPFTRAVLLAAIRDALPNPAPVP